MTDQPCARPTRPSTLFLHLWASSMVAAPWQCQSAFSGGSKAHIYGIPRLLPFVKPTCLRRPPRCPRPRKNHHRTHLADLTNVQGVVVTEFGPVSVSWEPLQTFNFSCQVPSGAATLLPRDPSQKTVTVDSDRSRACARSNRPRSPWQLVGNKRQNFIAPRLAAESNHLWQKLFLCVPLCLIPCPRHRLAPQ